MQHTQDAPPYDPRTELEHKADKLKWVALVETLTYVALFFSFAVFHNEIATAILGFVHGWMFIAFAVMVVWIWPSMGWRWYWIPLALLTGPLGGLLVFEKIRRDGVPPEKRGTRKPPAEVTAPIG